MPQRTVACSIILCIYLGKTTLAELGVTGNITAGVLSLHGLEGEINSIGQPLKLQSYGTDGIDILNGKLTIDTAGNMKTTGVITAKSIHTEELQITGNKTIGKAVLPAGQTSITIQTTAVDTDSSIFLTPITDLDAPLFVTSQIAGSSFTVKAHQPQSEDVKFKWWIVN